MYAQTTISEFFCDFCNKKFSVSQYDNDILKAQRAVQEHEAECRAKIKICLGDIYLFHITDNNLINDLKLYNCKRFCHCNCIHECCTFRNDYYLTPPMKVVWVDISNPKLKILHVVLAKYNHILKVWEEDQEAMKYFKKKYNIDHFTMYENQIDRQFSLKDFKQSFKIVEVLSDWVEETSAHGRKQCETNIGYDFQNNNVLLTIKIPYKTKGRIK